MKELESASSAWKRCMRQDYLSIAWSAVPDNPYTRTLYTLLAQVPWENLEGLWTPEDIRRLRTSGYWVWDHTCGWIGVRYYQVYASYNQAHDVHIAHKRVCTPTWDEHGWYRPPPDWRAYLSWPVIR